MTENKKPKKPQTSSRAQAQVRALEIEANQRKQLFEGLTRQAADIAQTLSGWVDQRWTQILLDRSHDDVLQAMRNLKSIQRTMHEEAVEERRQSEIVQIKKAIHNIESELASAGEPEDDDAAQTLQQRQIQLATLKAELVKREPPSNDDECCPGDQS